MRNLNGGKAILLFIIFFLSSLDLNALQKNSTGKVGIDEKLGSYVPLDVTFKDENGKPVTLKSMIKRPVVLAFVYYHCPGVCSPLLSGVAEVIDKVDLEPGRDFDVWTISFDPNDKPKDAKKWKSDHIGAMRRQLPESAWTYMTGDSLTIHRLTDAAGFFYKRDRGDFIHMGALIVLSPEGKITRYIFGTQFLPFDLKMAVIEAQKGETTPTVNKILAFCYSYDRQGGKYVFNVTKVIGSLMLFSAVVLFTVLVLKSRANKSKGEELKHG
ncbi:MAG: SCO family protein [Ignavibacteria bacterium]|jgi:protein SCO1/2|nr:SCO family protein [Ignavibacteria bacterium]MCU7503924.1 SCO family protein [Ignavibacteria bacterium]MCU7515855.1 SCO family protein [Ignavibacteria bacterium]